MGCYHNFAVLDYLLNYVIVIRELCKQKNTEPFGDFNVNGSVDIVDNYFFKRSVPIKSIFPAPIVINKSFFLQFFSA